MNAPAPSSDPALAGAVRKAQARLLPFLILMYVMAFIDRSNVGFAKAALQADIGLSDAAYAFGAGLFFCSYAVFEVPSNLILHRVGARVWLSRIMVTWGLVAAGAAMTRDPASFYLARFLLGIAEAGFFPGIIYYLTLWFPATARSQATGIFYFGLPLALVLGGPASGLLLDMPAPWGLHPWQFMFVVEGLMASLVGVVAYLYLTDRPAGAGWLSPAERAALSQAIEAEEARKVSHGPGSVLAAIRDPRIVMFCLIYFTIQVSVYGVVFYLPTRIAGLMGGQVGTTVGLLTAIPWMVAAAATWVMTRLADRTGRHRPLAAGMLALAAVGIMASTVSESVPLVVLSFCVAAAGFVSVQPLFWTVPTGYLGGAAAAGCIGLINAFGNLGGFVAPNLHAAVVRATQMERAGMMALAVAGVVGALMLVASRRGRAPAPPFRQTDLEPRR